MTRLVVLLATLAAVGFASLSGWQWFQDTRAADRVGESWFAGYVDVTATPSFDFEEPGSPEGRDVVLSFVVADPDEACAPSWGAAYSLDEASQSLDLDRRLARLRQQSGEAVVAFGGAANTELAVSCTDEDALYDAYREIVQRYEVSTIDIDVEGEAIDDVAANERRAAALKRLQDSDDVHVWLTLPVSPSGLAPSGVDLVATTLAADVDIAGVNLMTMNYNQPQDEDAPLSDVAISALEGAHEQLLALHKDAGVVHGPASMWRRMGATPMIGQNDVAAEIFTLGDAERLNAFARDKGLGRLSMWSLNRDRECGSNYPDTRVVSTSCSGESQDQAAFARALGQSVSGRPDADPAAVPEPPDPSATPTDDPATSPHEIWDPDEVYLAETRVVWRRNVYVAKWWTQGDAPDDPLVDAAAAPWELLGPVLPGETPLPTPTLPDGTYPRWAENRVYTSGDRVQLDGVPFVAQWWTKGQSPVAPSSVDSPSPWRMLTEEEIRKART
ncbi:MAG TPA: carbohydrate-binding protein [Nocardioides sp.]|nr:carbohydrate-binding protein [Nocardioides sp.]